MGVLGVFHPTITVSDMEGALNFYRDVLGLRPTFDGLHEPAALSRLLGYAEPEVRAVIVQAPDGTEIELAEFRRPKGRPPTDRRSPRVARRFSPAWPGRRCIRRRPASPVPRSSPLPPAALDLPKQPTTAGQPRGRSQTGPGSPSRP